MLKNTVQVQCDLCKWPAKTFDSMKDAEKEGWVTIGQECYYVERMFSESVICPSCAQKIYRQVSKSK